MQIETIAEWALRASDDRAVATLLARSFSTDFGGRSYFRQRPHVRLLIRDGARVVGHMAILWRAVRLGDQQITVAGLADVATDPDTRGKGVATALLQAAIAMAKASPADHMILFGNAPLYGGAGFVRVRNPLVYLDLTGSKTHCIRKEPAEQLMVLPLAEMAWEGTATLDLLGNLF